MLAFVGLIFCYRFGDQLLTSLLGPFLRDSGLDLKSIALMKGTVGNATSISVRCWAAGSRSAPADARPCS